MDAEQPHGRLLCGLLMRTVESAHCDEAFGCTRLTVDLFRSFPLEPIRIRAHRVRDGRRIRVVLVTIEADAPGADGKAAVIAQATAVVLRRSDQPVQDFLPTPRWDAPTIHQLTDVGRLARAGGGTWDSWRIPVEPDVGMNAQKGLWMREAHRLVDEEPLSPLVRAALAADLASSSTAGTPQGLSFINADFTIYFGRAPIGDVMGIEPTGHLSADGLAVGECRFHDEEGPFGFIGVTGVGNPIMRGRRSAQG